MSEIEKMYENAGIDYEERYNNCTLNKEGQCELKCSCDICEYSEEKYIYSTLTAEKQIELVKWLSKRCFYIEISEMADKSYGIAFRYQPTDEYKSEQSECCANKNFTEALAESINYIWQDLTEEEKQQVKGILE